MGDGILFIDMVGGIGMFMVVEGGSVMVVVDFGIFGMVLMIDVNGMLM